jgi:cellulose synthase/poly-beta-1,6-N-acetylglucosamine synthase-like glycosyltransferase
MIITLLLVLSLILTLQSGFTLYLMQYSWENIDVRSKSYPPFDFEPPTYSFTVLLPVRDEKDVIYETIKQVWQTNYPHYLLEVLVVSHSSDETTIAEAQRAIDVLGSPNIRVVTYDTLPINKPHGLNVGLRASSHSIVTIFDAEDDIAPDILRVVNTIFVREHVEIVQGGVQLMNYRDHWFSLLNCLEYFFWFKSRLHFHSAVGMIPLGGNTVFFARPLLEQLDGWDEHCLTEDADIGLRMSALGKDIRVFYDARYATREETPDSIGQFLRQRTRWHQGFLQIFCKGQWLKLPRLSQRLFAFYALLSPWLQALTLLIAPVTIILGIWFPIPVIVAMATFLPLYGYGLQIILSLLGAVVFVREYDKHLSLRDIIVMIITFFPYQILQGLSALRAIERELFRKSDWEKTTHIGAHR